MKEYKSNTRALELAKKTRNDEFYTFYDDIKREVMEYTDQFFNKIVYCNCDNSDSNFVKFFKDNYNRLGLKGLSWSGLTDEVGVDFRGSKAIKKLKEADIVITNPPFSLIREYLDQCINYKKKFLIIAPITALGYIGVSPHIRDGLITVGKHDQDSFFYGDQIVRAPSIWMTNLDINYERKKFKPFVNTYNKIDYPELDCFKCILIKRLQYIPRDYYGYMAVPVTYLKHHHPDSSKNMFDFYGNFRTLKPEVWRKVIKIDKAIHVSRGFREPFYKQKHMFMKYLIRRKPHTNCGILD